VKGLEDLSAPCILPFEILNGFMWLILNLTFYFQSSRRKFINKFWKKRGPVLYPKRNKSLS